jgi:hypothetical protein
MRGGDEPCTSERLHFVAGAVAIIAAFSALKYGAEVPMAGEVPEIHSNSQFIRADWGGHSKQEEES